MNEQTHPETGVSQADPMERMLNLVAQSEDPALNVAEAPKEEEAEATEAQPSEPEGQAELSPEDLPEVEGEAKEQPVDEFEIVRDGQQIKLSREETIKYAQQGFDYTKKTQAVAEKERQVSARLQQLQEIEQVQPHIAASLAQVKAIEAQLKPWANVDWVQLATDDPMGYPKYRAQYDVLVNGYQQAVGEHQKNFHQVVQHRQKVQAEMLAAEEARLPDLIPEWKDPAKKTAGKAELLKYLTQYGGQEVPAEAIGQKLTDAMSVSIAYKAMKYDQLLKSKSEKVKQLRTAPPVTVPGAKSTTATADKDKALQQRLRKTGSLDDAAAVLLNRMK